MRCAAAVLLALVALPAGGDELATPPPQPRSAGRESSADRAARAYALAADRPGPVAVGAQGTVTVAIRCEPGVHVQRQAPLRATASASSGLELAKARLGWEDAVDAADGRGVELPVSFVTSAPGAAEVRLRLIFFVCSDEWCVRQDREVAIPVAVSADGRAAPKSQVR